MSLAISKLTFSAIKDGWITSQKQLDRLTLSLNQQIEQATPFPFCVAAIVAYYAADPNLVSWFFSLERLNALPKLLPPLPWNIDQILNGRCPIFWHLSKSDGSHFKVTDTHILTLIPDELGTINLFEERVQRYCQEQKLKNANAFQFRHFSEPARLEHGDAPFDRIHWELFTTRIMTGSQYRTPSLQDEIIHSLAKKIYILYQPLSLKNTIVALFLHKLATGVSFYPKGKQEDGADTCFTLVQESLPGRRLVVGSFAEDGLYVDFLFIDMIGVGSGIGRKFF